jgi:hypothetical protein
MKKYFKKLQILSVCMFVLFAQNCTQDDFDSDINNTESKIIELAQKYDVEIEIIHDDLPAIKKNNLSMTELESLFSNIKENKKKNPVTMEIYKTDNGEFLYRSNTPINFPLRLKSGDENTIYNSSTWAYNLTWFNVSVSAFNGDYSVMSCFNGVTIYSYEQIESTYQVNGNTITFNPVGRAEFTIGCDSFGIRCGTTVFSEGSFNLTTGKGAVKV